MNLEKIGERLVYRAMISLGSLPEDSADRLNAASAEGRPDMRLNQVGLSVYPAIAGGMDDEEFKVGWIGVSISGNGYPFPLTPAELVARAEAEPCLRRLAHACRDLLPVTRDVGPIPLWWRLPGGRRRWACDMRGGEPSARCVRVRRKMGGHWPYPADAPHDWRWLVHETG